MADDSDLQTPPATAERTWKDSSVPGANVQVGCSSNGSIAVCGLSGGSSSDAGTAPPSLVAYAPGGSHVWAYAPGTGGFPAPMVDVNGGAIAANVSGVVRIGAIGKVLWTAPGPLGAPKTPTPVGTSYVFLATSPASLHSNHAPVATYDTASGSRVHSYDVVSPPGAAHPVYYYSSGNSPAVSGSRAYVVMSRAKFDGSRDSCSVGRLVAFDMASDGAITEAWRSAAFEAPSGASPMVDGSRISFDGAHPAPLRSSCLEDDGTPSDGGCSVRHERSGRWGRRLLLRAGRPIDHQ